MKTYLRLVPIAIFVIISATFTGKTIAQTDDANYVFVIFETTVTKKGVETNDANPEERRFYVSNVVAFTSRDPSVLRNVSHLADEYFTANVVEPMKTKGILHQYYDDGIRINDNVVYRLDTKEQVEELQRKALQELKEQSANVFTFTWAYGEKANGLDTSHPVLYYHEPKKPLYGTTDAKPPTRRNN